ncbi:XRE family transcriptional regulator [Yersinia rochesterensis]|uniref:helix-turn-helix domain-containing protein n=1 Tax=Yersinia rochesterensis TaxID=1604335 RepID=UPI0028532E84|nr:XRE family transcriptional regulator [Yersinia rochesterensis]MDR5020528.1 XRE family transcriptional regulator [Yersinia rochesterensis]HEI6963670.1 ImmA/IrrE family metallo-endopeptidase [Yersinia enterocolitica]
MNTKIISHNFAERSFNPQRLAEAREAKGLTMAELARVLDISRQAISSFEKGIKAPSHETLMTLSKVLGFPERFFVSSHSSPEIKGAVHFRSRATATKKARMSGRARGRWVSLILQECSKYAQLPPVILPDLDIIDFESLEKSDIEEIATAVRRYWQLGDGPIVNLTKLLENKGIVVSHLSSGEKVDAFSFWEGDRPVVILDKSKTAVRMRFSLAHELGHLIMHRTVEDDYLEDKQLFELVESQADYFASCFLMPSNTFGREYYSPSLSALEQLKERWITSIGSITMRAHSLNIMSDNQKVYVFRQLAPYRRKEPLDDVIPKEKPQLLYKLLKLLDTHSIMKTSDLIDIFGLPITDLSAITQLSESELTQGDNIISFVLRGK